MLNGSFSFEPQSGYFVFVCGALFSGVRLLRRSAPLYISAGRNTQLERRGSFLLAMGIGIALLPSLGV